MVVKRWTSLVAVLATMAVTSAVIDVGSGSCRVRRRDASAPEERSRSSPRTRSGVIRSRARDVCIRSRTTSSPCRTVHGDRTASHTGPSVDAEQGRRAHRPDRTESQRRVLARVGAGRALPGLDLTRTGPAPRTDIGASLDPDAPIVLFDATTASESVLGGARRRTHAPGEVTQLLYIRPAVNFPKVIATWSAARPEGRRRQADRSRPTPSAPTGTGSTPTTLRLERRRPAMERIFETSAARASTATASSWRGTSPWPASATCPSDCCTCATTRSATRSLRTAVPRRLRPGGDQRPVAPNGQRHVRGAALPHRNRCAGIDAEQRCRPARRAARPATARRPPTSSARCLARPSGPTAGATGRHDALRPRPARHREPGHRCRHAHRPP